MSDPRSTPNPYATPVPGTPEAQGQVIGAQRGHALIDRAIRVSLGIVLADAAAVEQAGGAVVALTRGDCAVGYRSATSYQTRPASRGSQRSASRVTLTSFSTTLSTCSFTC